MGVIAIAISANAPLPGQEHRSGPDFEFFTDDGTTITISCPQGIVFDIKQDLRWAIDPTPVSEATNGTQIAGSVLATEKKYYIANPQHATGNFTVTLSQN